MFVLPPQPSSCGFVSLIECHIETQIEDSFPVSSGFVILNRHTQLLFATSIEGGIPDSQVLKYQPSVTSRVIFHHLIPLIIIKY